MKVQEFAQITGVSTKTIRYYESIGILSSPVRMANGYRNYNKQDVERARFVRNRTAAFAYSVIFTGGKAG